MIGKVGRESSIEVGRTGLEVSGESSVLHGQVVVFFFVHFFVHHILFRHAQRATRTTLVDLRGSTCGLHARLQASIAPPGSGNVGAFLVLLVGSFGLDGFGRRGTLRRHDGKCGRRVDCGSRGYLMAGGE